MFRARKKQHISMSTDKLQDSNETKKLMSLLYNMINLFVYW